MRVAPATLFALLAGHDAASAQDSRLREPLPLDAAITLRGHNQRSPIDVSPDGQWIAHTIRTEDTLPYDSRMFSPTGVSFAEGNARMEATLTHARSGERIRLGGPTSSSWGASWSPDGTRVAFYSDEGGEAGLWIWDAATRRASRFEGLIVRTAFGFEVPRWSPDGTRLIVKLLPEGMTIAECNALGARRTPRPEPAVDPDGPTVVVREVVPPDERPDVTQAAVDPAVQQSPIGDMTRWHADLAVVDLEQGSARRLVERAAVRDYAFSPSGTRVGFSLLKGGEPASQQSNYDLGVIDLASGELRTLATNVRITYGNEWSFSPDGEQIAYLPSGQLVRRAVRAGATDERMVLIDVATGKTTSIRNSKAPTLDPGDGEVPPLWDDDGESLYAIGDGAVWRVERASGELARVAGLPGWRIRGLVHRPENATVWTTADGETLWAIARHTDGTRSAILSIEAATGETEIAWEENATYSSVFNLDAADATGEIAFVSADQQHLAGLRVFDTRTGAARHGPAVNPALDRYELGTVTVIEYRSPAGRLLRGALLLPPGDQHRKLPLVVWVYGGSLGSKAVNRFGLALASPAFNMHVLATRGYAVLFPDAPLAPGHTTRDLMSSVMPAVDAAIEQGYADPDRLAIMGQSYGSINVLAILTETPRFDAAIITAAVIHPDLFAAYLDSVGYFERGQGAMGGTIWESPERYRENSPIHGFDRIVTPLLIGQGDRDGDLVPANAIFNALERLQKPVEFRLYEGEGHVITRAANVRDFWERRLEFLAEHLRLRVDEKGRVVSQAR